MDELGGNVRRRMATVLATHRGLSMVMTGGLAYDAHAGKREVSRGCRKR